MSKRKNYSKEFKQDAINLVLEQGYSRAEAARSLDLYANMLGRWIKEYQKDEGHAFRGNGVLTSEQEEIRRLKAENKRLSGDAYLKLDTFIIRIVVANMPAISLGNYLKLMDLKAV